MRSNIDENSKDSHDEVESLEFLNSKIPFSSKSLENCNISILNESNDNFDDSFENSVILFGNDSNTCNQVSNNFNNDVLSNNYIMNDSSNDSTNVLSNVSNNLNDVSSNSYIMNDPINDVSNNLNISSNAPWNVLSQNNQSNDNASNENIDTSQQNQSTVSNITLSSEDEIFNPNNNENDDNLNDSVLDSVIQNDNVINNDNDNVNAHSTFFSNHNKTIDKKEWLKCAQINLHHSMGPVHVLNRWLAKSNNKNQVVFCHEPYLNKRKQISGFTKDYMVFRGKANVKVRSCILVSKGLEAWPMNQFCDEDTTTIGIKIKDKLFAFCSAYFPYDSPTPPPNKLIKDLSDFCTRKGWGLLIGADANSHNEAWGSTKTNERGEVLLDFIQENGLHVCNEGNEPTFQDCTRSQVIDLTIANTKMVEFVKGWHVSKEATLSDHNRIEYFLGLETEVSEETYRNIRKTDWGKYVAILKKKLETLNFDDDLDTLVENLTKIITDAWKESCKRVRKRKKKKADPTWWTKELTALRVRYRQVKRKYYRNRGKVNPDRPNQDEENHAEYTEHKNRYRKVMDKEYSSSLRKSLKILPFSKIPKKCGLAISFLYMSSF